MPGRTLPPLNGSNGAHEDDEESNNDSDYESEAPDATTALEELSPDEFPAYFSERNGRLFHSATSPYPLPVDTPEQTRLNTLAGILYRLTGAPYIGPVAELLAPQPESERRQMVLDVGTGTGRWVIEMAQIFPHVHFRGFDIVPIATRYPPRNVQFELHDVNAPGPMRWAAGMFDLVNTRFVDMAVLDYTELAQEAGRLLRPGGMLMSYEWSRLPAFDPAMGQDPNVHAPASVQFFSAINAALAARRVYQLAGHVPAFLASTGLFTDISAREYHVPIGPWPADPALHDIGVACLSAQQEYARSIRQLLLDSGGGTQHAVDSLVDEYLHEINSVRGLVSILYMVHARRL
ncbi:hypothetical protein HYPSUDRAFT_453725 [Hypholoma sublateritium FD-334 SS-4]|uniref:Methyltransferase domain-containing protein n=1 Tax=Hypholoma sublateritium (strain FD-334 SS-4) TaxID=945553 RepID=A0A0D2LCB2_HYPSF|nr:hypothetical protein HYPSUDRAFT_453725 [Hypholoma sublateritium FD-334 SS-4]